MGSGHLLMSLKPVIFLSAVSSELKAARELVAKTLTFLGYEPDWQNICGPEHGDQSAMLRRPIDTSAGVTQAIGAGTEPNRPSRTPPFGVDETQTQTFS